MQTPHRVPGLIIGVNKTQLSHQGAYNLLRETEVCIIHLIMATCSKCFDKATKKNESVTRGEINSSVEGGVRKEKLSEPGFERWSVGDAHSKMKNCNEHKGLKRGKQDSLWYCYKESQEDDCG